VPRVKRGEIWMADLGLAAKVRPVLVLSVAYELQERAIVSYVIRTTNTRKVWVRYRRSNSKGEWDSSTLRRRLKWKMPFELGLGSKAPLLVSFPVSHRSAVGPAVDLSL
jgi:hypothetical protein